MAKIKYYVILKGRQTGIFEEWENVKNLVTGYSDASFKSFNDYDEAYSYYHSHVDNFCKNCGVPVNNSDFKYCPYCGNLLKEE